MVSVEHQEGVAVLSLDQGVTNPLNLVFVKRITECFAEVEDDAAVQAVVFTGSNDKFFSIGFDIPDLFMLPREDFAVFLRTFDRLSLRVFTFPKPVIAGLRGHAIAGGCILALMCDYRYMAEGRKLMGLNEIKLGVPIPYTVDCVLRGLVGPRIARDMVDSGEFYESAHLAQIGLVDKVLPQGEVLPEALAKARELGAMPGKAFAAIKRARTEGVESEILARLAENQEAFIDCWFSEAAREQLTKAMEAYRHHQDNRGHNW